MKFLEVTVITSREFADVVSLALIELGSEGTVIKDNADIKELFENGIIWDYVDEHLLCQTDSRVFVSGFLGEACDSNAITKYLIELEKDSEIDTGAYEISIREINSADWENEWKKYYMPIEFSSFVIVPEWIKSYKHDNKRLIFLNPGMAFGTGSHETTSMCLKFIDGLNFADKTVIDLGCGSGILGITAASLGAKEVLLTDIDPYAIKCATDNSQLNELKNINILVADLLNNQIGKKADILTANLTAPLLLLAKDGIKKHLISNAILIISGILKDYNEDVLESYLQDFTLIQSLQNGEWHAHLLSYKG